MRIYFKRGYKYQLVEDFQIILPGLWQHEALDDFIILERNGELTVKKHYAWDGPSGPAIDTCNFMKASLVHDALYQLMRLHKLPYSYRKQADQALEAICKMEGMLWIRRKYVYLALRCMGAKAATERRKIIVI